VLETLDDTYEPEKAAAKHLKPIEERDAFALFGCIGASTCATAGRAAPRIDAAPCLSPQAPRQVVPCGVSSSTTPAASNSARMRSASA
jgi:hypothetical protein